MGHLKEAKQNLDIMLQGREEVDSNNFCAQIWGDHSFKFLKVDGFKPLKVFPKA